MLATAGVGVGGLVVAGGIGAAIAAVPDLPARSPDSSNRSAADSGQSTATRRALLTAAVAAEQQLLDGLDAVLAAGPVQPILLALRSDHVAHLQAITTLIGSASPVGRTSAPAPTGRTSPASVAGTPPVTPTAPSGATATAAPATGAAALVLLAAAERSAHDFGITRANQLSGSAAVVLASIAACEAGHAELLT
jgi:hypothetical protein